MIELVNGSLGSPAPVRSSHLINKGKQGKGRMIIKSNQTQREHCKLDVLLLETSPRGVKQQDRERQKPTQTALTEHET